MVNSLAGHLTCSNMFKGPFLRIVHEESGVHSSPYGAYAIPKDFVDIASGEDPAKLMELLQLVSWLNISNINYTGLILLCDKACLLR